MTMHLRAKTITANHCSDGLVHIEAETTKGQLVDIELEVPQGPDFRDAVEDAVLEQEHALDRGAAGPWDPGAAA